MKISYILDIADKPIKPDQLPLVASLMAIKLGEINKLMPEIMKQLKSVAIHSKCDFEGSTAGKELSLLNKLNKWMKE